MKRQMWQQSADIPCLWKTDLPVIFRRQEMPLRTYRHAAFSCWRTASTLRPTRLRLPQSVLSPSPYT